MNELDENCNHLFSTLLYYILFIFPSTQTEKPPSPPVEEDSEEEGGAPVVNSGRVSVCHTEGCTLVADHSIRRKWLIKMRSSVNKLVSF